MVIRSSSGFMNGLVAFKVAIKLIFAPFLLYLMAAPLQADYPLTLTIYKLNEEAGQLSQKTERRVQEFNPTFLRQLVVNQPDQPADKKEYKAYKLTQELGACPRIDCPTGNCSCVALTPASMPSCGGSKLV